MYFVKGAGANVVWLMVSFKFWSSDAVTLECGEMARASEDGWGGF